MIGKRLHFMEKLLVTFVILCLLLMGCSKEEEVPDKVRDLDFTVVGEQEQPDALKEIIAERSKEAFQISYTLGSSLYIAVGYGEQPSGGYSICVNAFYEGEEELFIDTTLIGPGKADNVTNTPTTPYIVIKTEEASEKPIQFK